MRFMNGITSCEEEDSMNTQLVARRLMGAQVKDVDSAEEKIYSMIDVTLVEEFDP